MAPLTVFLVVAQVVVPVGLLLWLALRRPSSLAAWLVGAALALMWLSAIAVAGLWLVVPRTILWLLALAWIAAAVRSGRRTAGLPLLPATRRGRIVLAAQLVATVPVVAFTLYALSGRRSPNVQAFAIASPLRGGGYVVANGGSNIVVNSHMATRDDIRFAAWRGQSYALDVVQLSAWGTRANGLLPRDPSAYEIFGDTVFAPCDGVVLHATDDLTDLQVPDVDREHMAGNHVILQCDDVYVVLAHLLNRSVTVAPGDVVSVGSPLGRVGNTGNTNEPHLHIHIQTPGTDDAPLGGEPVPMFVDGRYLARNQRVPSLPPR